MAINNLKGVRGWLLIFCLSMTIRPLLMFQILIKLFPAFDNPEYPKAILVLFYGLSLAIAFFGLYSALLLWTVNRKAVAVTRVYLFCMLAYYMLVALFPYLFSADLQESALVKFFWAMQHSLYVGIIYFAIWFAYLSKSQRVANTYIANNSFSSMDS